jgi:hypothetical protein
MAVVLAVKQQNRREGDSPLSGNGASTFACQVNPMDIERKALPEFLEQMVRVPTEMTTGAGDEQHLNWLR